MVALNSREKSEFINMVQRIPDDKVRYFYLMLGSALAGTDSQSGEATAPNKTTLRANTSADHIAALQARFNR